MQRDYIKYPLRFKPVFKQTIWGGSKIASFMEACTGGVAQLPDGKIGECWGISAVDGYESVVVNGDLKGMSLPDVVAEYGAKVLGKRNVERFGNVFPLLVKFIDADSDLSVQVHPNDALAAERHNGSGKTEMWYVIDAEDRASLLSGFAKDVSKSDFIKMDGVQVLNSLSRFRIAKGDLFYLPAGTVHSIGAGAFIAEIQQSSDITYRIYDFDRVDDLGKRRELHTEQALEAIDFSIKGVSCKVPYKEQKGTTGNLWDYAFKAVDCEYFSTSVVKLDYNPEECRVYSLDYSHLDSFVILTCVAGSALLLYGNGEQMALVGGDVILLPADLQSVQIVVEKENKFEFLETHI